MKVTIKGIVRENREDLLIDKIVESLLNDTEYKVYHRFMGEYVCEVKFPMFKGLPRIYDRVDIVEFINMFKDQKDSELTSFRSSIDWNNYLESNYGMSGEHNVSKIGIRYYNTLFARILKDFDDYHYVPDYGPVNESVDNREEQIINKITRYLLEDTEVEVNKRYERVYINYPFEGFNSYTPEKVLPLILKRGYDINFVNYVNGIYSIKDWNLITNISQRYYSLLYDKVKEMLGSSNNFMNESVERKEETLNRIVDYMISDTKWDVYIEHEEDWEYVKVTMYWPGGDHEDYNTSDFEVVWEKFIMGEIDRKYLEQQFGITEEWIKQELYNRYIHKLRPIIYEEMISYFE